MGWVETQRVLDHVGRDAQRYRAYVEAGKGEKPVSPLERAVAGLVLGGDQFVARVRRLLAGRSDSVEVPSLKRLRRTARARIEKVEAALEDVFPDVSARRRNRLLLYAPRRYSLLRPIEIARLRSRTPAAVTVATTAVEAEAVRHLGLARSLRLLAKRLQMKD